MEDFKVDFTLDQGPHARVLPLSLAASRSSARRRAKGLLSAPFRARFGIAERLEPYPPRTSRRSSRARPGSSAVEIDRRRARADRRRARGTPRIANRFLRRARDLAQVDGARADRRALRAEALDGMGVDENGLEELDRRILACSRAGAGNPPA
jgi:Holliday junction DNA helicase RuvB